MTRFVYINALGLLGFNSPLMLSCIVSLPPVICFFYFFWADILDTNYCHTLTNGNVSELDSLPSMSWQTKVTIQSPLDPLKNPHILELALLVGPNNKIHSSSLGATTSFFECFDLLNI
jgi:hypothetical protein